MITTFHFEVEALYTASTSTLLNIELQSETNGSGGAAWNENTDMKNDRQRITLNRSNSP